LSVTLIQAKQVIIIVSQNNHSVLNGQKDIVFDFIIFKKLTKSPEIKEKFLTFIWEECLIHPKIEPNRLIKRKEFDGESARPDFQ
jgi:hypothetical protein